MEKTRIRRSTEELIDAIYDALPVNTYAPVTHIAADGDMDWKTAQKYLLLILHIQSKQGGGWLIRKRVGANFAYARKTQAGRPRKG